MQKVTADVAVVAAGPAGLAAAITAAEQGASVVVFEKMVTAGGTANMGMGPFGVESRIQKRCQNDLTKEKAFEELMKFTHWNVDAHIVRDYLWKSGSTIDWLEDMGVEFERPSKMFAGGYETWHVVKPEGGGMPGPRSAATMNKIMQKNAQDLGVKFYFETPVKSLRKEGDKVIGFMAVDKTGEEYEVTAKAVVMATGGFGCNREMIKSECGYTLGEDYFGWAIPGIEGDGLRMAWEAGAGKGRTSMECNIGCAIPGDGTFPSVMLFHQPRVLMVNKLGERVMNESTFRDGAVAANVMSRQPEKCAYMIMDDGILKHFRKYGTDYTNEVFRMDLSKLFYNEIDAALEQYPNTIFAADSIEELAEKTGISVENLVETVEEYNAACENYYDDLYLKDRKYLQKLEGKKYYALRMNVGAYGSLGGIRINYKYEVLTEDWKTIEGLYAAGSDVCDIYNGTYCFLLAGNTMGFALNSGRIAGENAVNYAFTH